MTRHGGHRPGAGRPPLPDEERTRTVSVQLPPAVLEAVGEAAERAGQSRSAWMREAIERRLRRRRSPA